MILDGDAAGNGGVLSSPLNDLSAPFANAVSFGRHSLMARFALLGRLYGGVVNKGFTGEKSTNHDFSETCLRSLRESFEGRMVLLGKEPRPCDNQDFLGHFRV